jgi:hypothetical protein
MLIFNLGTYKFGPLIWPSTRVLAIVPSEGRISGRAIVFRCWRYFVTSTVLYFIESVFRQPLKISRVSINVCYFPSFNLFSCYFICLAEKKRWDFVHRRMHRGNSRRWTMSNHVSVLLSCRVPAAWLSSVDCMRWWLADCLGD